MHAPSRSVELHVVGTVEEDGELVGRVATTVRIWEGETHFLCAIGEGAGVTTLPIAKGRRRARFLRALLDHIELGVGAGAGSGVAALLGTTGLA